MGAGRKVLFSRLLLTFTVCVGLAGCAPTKQVEVTEPVAPGFLPEPQLLQPGKGEEASLRYLRPGTDWSSYSKMMIEPILFFVDRSDGSSDDTDQVPPEQRQVLASAMHTYLYDAAAKHCQMVDVPSPGTFVLRFAIVEAEASKPTMNTISSYVPQLNMLTSLGASAFNSGIGFFVGGATFEGYAIDGGNGVLLWQGVDRRVGAQAFGSDTISSWADVDKTFRSWANTFSNRIVELGICSKAPGTAANR